MNTRIAVKADIKAIREMWNDYYGLSENFCDWFFNRAFYSQNSIVVTEDEDIAASSGFVPYKIRLGNNEIDAAYIAGMVMLPEYRTNENVRRLTADTLLSIEAKDIPISLIIPYKYREYEKYGFRTCYNFKQYTLTPDDIPAFSVRHRIKRHKINDKVIECLSALYTEHTSDKNGIILRSKENWQLILEDLIANFGGKIAIAYDEQENAQGYILYVVRDGVMRVYEMGYTSRRAYESLMGYIKGHELNVGKITIKTSEKDLSYLDFCGSKNPISVFPFVMARINNAESVLKYLEFDGRVKIQVIDRLIEDNNRTFEISDGEVKIVEESGDIAVDIGTLTMLVFGYIGLDEAADMGLVTGNIGAAEGLFEKRDNFINMLYF